MPTDSWHDRNPEWAEKEGSKEQWDLLLLYPLYCTRKPLVTSTRLPIVQHMTDGTSGSPSPVLGSPPKWERAAA